MEHPVQGAGEAPSLDGRGDLLSVEEFLARGLAEDLVGRLDRHAVQEVVSDAVQRAQPVEAQRLQ
ncbi:hypothetical protein, partial [Streptomyces kanamyceticus]|uniref:hypothetical protein n=1 Tax=Streptomyces kanamyceticus TaxID=1967 RepID=UPI0019810910